MTKPAIITHEQTTSVTQVGPWVAITVERRQFALLNIEEARRLCQSLGFAIQDMEQPPVIAA